MGATTSRPISAAGAASKGTRWWRRPPTRNTRSRERLVSHLIVCGLIFLALPCLALPCLALPLLLVLLYPLPTCRYRLQVIST